MSETWTQLAWVLVLSLAAARVSVLIVHDTITEPIRDWIFLRWPPRDAPGHGYDYQHRAKSGEYLPVGEVRDWHYLAELLTCTRCVSVWVTGGLYVLAALAGPVGGGEVEHLLKMLAAMWLASWGAERI